MVSINTFKKIALALEHVSEKPHFDKTSFNVNKKIFATLNEVENRATIRLSLLDQDVFCLYDKNVMYPVPNKWGKHGWTHINLKTIPKAMCQDALHTAYLCVSTKKKS
jgi:predicted DNA-binding protein (MmcQ/YjbR family)